MDRALGDGLAVYLVGAELPFEELPEVAGEVSRLVEIENQVVVLLFEHTLAEFSKRKRRTVIDESIDDSHECGLISHGPSVGSRLEVRG
jgi:hypothetical protein